MSQSNKENNTSQSNTPMPEVDALISDEVLRGRVRKIVDAPPREPLLERITKHPLLTLVLGFGLTWGVGTLLTNRWEQARLENQRVIERERQESETRLSAFNEFFGILHEHRARAFLVDQALARDAPVKELADLVQAERDLFAKSNARLGLILFTLRDLMPPETYMRIVKDIDNGVYVPLQSLDQAHATAYEDKLEKRRKPKFTEWEQENAARKSGQITLCSQALVEAIWYSTIARSKHEKDLEEKKEGALYRMDEECKLQP